MGVDFAAIRRDEFSALAGAIYLNSASIGPLPERTRRRLDEYNALRAAPFRLSDHEMFAELDRARALTAQLLNVTAGEIALTFNTSYGLNLAARGLPLEPGDVVVASDREFPANVYPWMRLKERGVALELAPVTANGWPDEDHLVERMADPKVRALAVSLVQFSNGYTVDLARLSKRARATNTFLVVDAIQGLGAVPVDLQDTPVDILSCGGQKWLLSPWGSGFVYVRKELIPVVEPVVMGWMAFEGTDDFTSLLDYADALRADARRFEVGTVATQDVMAMTTSLGLIRELGVEAISAWTCALSEPLLAWADRRCVRVVSPRDGVHRCGIVCLAPDDARDAHRRLKAAGVVCAFREGAIRFSPHAYNTPEEMEKVVEVLDGVIS